MAHQSWVCRRSFSRFGIRLTFRTPRCRHAVEKRAGKRFGKNLPAFFRGDVEIRTEFIRKAGIHQHGQCVEEKYADEEFLLLLLRVHTGQFEDIPEHIVENCIYRYHCTTVCPQKAILCPTEKVAEMAQKNRKILGDE